MGEGGGGEEKGFFPSPLFLFRFHFPPFPQKRLILRLLILFSSVIGKVQYVWKKRSNSDAIKEVTSKEQNFYPSGPSCLEAD